MGSPVTILNARGVRSWSRAANLTRIRESIRSGSIFENQFLSLNHLVIVMVAIKFDSYNLDQNCTPVAAWGLEDQRSLLHDHSH